ncbi:GNAT family N-acetyltransferase [Halobacterium rubrum]|uniref:GNAT family N-acetyltransferase n=1 Tax=Halobacterium TaxID=2239 RepID=UPI001F25F93D|nr:MULTISPECIES: GNAT family protein [Halobacterium]MDH5018836.1 GNAT family protein [Halobacterium rubrum]
MPGPAFTTGERVSLHPIEDEDHEFLQRGRNHPEVRVPLTDTDVHTIDDVAELVDDADQHFLVCEKPDGDEAPTRVGVVAFTWTSEPPKSGDMMYWVLPEHQGNGYVTEATELFLDYAFRECGYHKVTARALETNAASIAVLEKLGFQREGTLRDDHFVDGDLVDAHAFGLLADEWLAE